MECVLVTFFYRVELLPEMHFRTFASRQRDECFGEQDSSNNDDFHVPWPLCEFQYLHLVDFFLELLRLLDFRLIGDLDLGDERLFGLIFWRLESLQLTVFFDFPVTFNDYLLGGSARPLLSSLTVSALSCVNWHSPRTEIRGCLMKQPTDRMINGLDKIQIRIALRNIFDFDHRFWDSDIRSSIDPRLNNLIAIVWRNRFDAALSPSMRKYCKAEACRRWFPQFRSGPPLEWDLCKWNQLPPPSSP